jgi:hypothetical protein
MVAGSAAAALPVPLLATLTREGFIYLADDPPRELVVGSVKRADSHHVVACN